MLTTSAAECNETLYPTLAIAGAGRVGSALALLLSQRGWPISGVWSRSPDAAARLAQQLGAAAWTDPADLAGAQLVLLTVPDGVIGACAETIAQAGGWRPGQGVVHCSGAVEVAALAPAQAAGAWIGGFHPLQAVATIEAALAVLPGSFFALEGVGPLRDWLPALAKSLDGTWQWLNPGARPLYHAAAVFASNYVVTLFSVGVRLLAQAGLTPDQASAALAHLTAGAVRNLAAVGLPGALTGPIRRGDAQTVARHLAALDAASPELAALYRDLAWQTLPLAQALNLDPQALDAVAQVVRSGIPIQ
jgi:predicted short-subunit dehydrogenase-like oxidoreductase (DUF2520 family)